MTEQKRGPNGRFIRKLRPTPQGSREWLIWSRYHHAWHRRSKDGGACGYTSDLAQAGLFDRAKASAYHDGDRDEAFHVEEKLPAIREAMAQRISDIIALGILASAVDEGRR